MRRASNDDAWELVHPRCANERREDLEEVQAMLDAGEPEIAMDELRWLLSGCSDFIEAHYLLGTIALAEQNDVPLARAHFGYAYQLGATALARADSPAPLPHRLPANRAFHEAGKGLAWFLAKLGKPEMAAEIIETLLRCDPTDPLGVAAMKSIGGQEP